MFDLLKKFEKLLVKLLMLLMALVLGLATVDLGWIVLQDVITPPVFVLEVSELLDIFGLFMLVLIGIELLDTIMKTYLAHGMPHYEVVLSVAIIAIARKVIILDLKEWTARACWGSRPSSSHSPPAITSCDAATQTRRPRGEKGTP